MRVELVDFVSVPTRDVAASVATHRGSLDFHIPLVYVYRR